MLKVVLDTNVIVRATITDHGVSFNVLRKWRNGEFGLITSEPILEEVEKVLHYPKIKKKRQLTEKNIKDILERLRKYSFTTPALIKIEAVTEDPEDNKFLTAAIEGEADYIISGDRHLKGLGSYRGVKILSPAEFMEVKTKTANSKEL